MGGDYYERDVEVAAVDNKVGYSNAANKVLDQNKALHKSNDPKRFAGSRLVSDHKHPIVFALDVTGSMGDWSKVYIDILDNYKDIYIYLDNI